MRRRSRSPEEIELIPTKGDDSEIEESSTNQPQTSRIAHAPAFDDATIRTIRDQLVLLAHVVRPRDPEGLFIDLIEALKNDDADNQLASLFIKKNPTKCRGDVARRRDFLKERLAELLELLQTKLTLLNRKDLRNSEMSILHKASFKNAHIAVNILIMLGCDLNITDSLKRTPLMLACKRNSEKVINLFFARIQDIDISLKDENQATILHYLTSYCREPIIIRFLKFPRRVAEEIETHPVDGWQGRPKYEELIRLYQELINSQDNKIRVTPFQTVVERCFLEALQEMIEIIIPFSQDQQSKEKLAEIEIQKREIVKKNQDNYPLHKASSFGNDRINVEMVLSLIRLGFSTDVVNDQRETPVHSAAKFNHHYVIISLLTLKSWEEIKKMEQEDTVDEAMENNNGQQQIDEDAANQASLEETNTSGESVKEIISMLDGRQNLRSAQVQDDNVEVNAPDETIPDQREQDLLEVVRVRDIHGMTALLHSARTNSWEAAKELIRWSTYLQKAQKNWTKKELFFEENDEGENLLIIAAKHKHSEYIENLINELAERGLVNATFISEFESTRKSPLHCTAENGSLRGTKKLIKSKAHLNVLNGSLQSPLHVACREGHLDVVNYFLTLPEVISILNSKDEKLCTSLQLAAQNGYPEVCRALLKKGANPKLVNQRGMTAFDSAAAHGNLDCVKCLKKYCEIDGEKNGSVNKKTPLHYAAERGHEKVVEYLLKHGANIEQTYEENGIEKTVLDLALDSNQREVAKTLLNTDDWEKLMLRSNVAKPKDKQRDSLETPMRRLIKGFPELAALVMNRCIKKNDTTAEITYNFQLIDDTYVMPIQGQEGEYAIFNESTKRSILKNGKVHAEAVPYSEDRLKIYENHPLKLMMDSPNPDIKALIEDPLVIALLDYRWETVTEFHYFFLSLIPLLFYLFFYTGFLCLEGKWRNDADLSEPKMKTFSLDEIQINVSLSRISNQTDILQIGKQDYRIWLHLVLMILPTPWLFYLFAKEFYQVRIFGPMVYIMSVENLVEVSAYVLTGITLLSKALEFFKFSGVHEEFFSICAAIGTGFLWMNLLMLSRRWKFFGIFVLMFKNVFVSFLKFVLIFFFFIMAFSFSYYFLMQNREEFSTILRSMLKTLVMSTGEMDFTDVFFEEDRTEKTLLKKIAMGIFAAFVVVMVILVMNLLTGLAVGDIEKVQDDATIEGRKIQAESVLLVERVWGTKALKRQLYIVTIDPNKERFYWRTKWKHFKHWLNMWTFSSYGFLCSFCLCCCCCCDKRDELDKEAMNQPKLETEPTSRSDYDEEDESDDHVSRPRARTLEDSNQMTLHSETTARIEQLTTEVNQLSEILLRLTIRLADKETVRMIPSNAPRMKDDINSAADKPGSSGKTQEAMLDDDDFKVPSIEFEIEQSSEDDDELSTRKAYVAFEDDQSVSLSSVRVREKMDRRERRAFSKAYKKSQPKKVQFDELEGLTNYTKPPKILWAAKDPNIERLRRPLVERRARKGELFDRDIQDEPLDSDSGALEVRSDETGLRTKEPRKRTEEQKTRSPSQ